MRLWRIVGYVWAFPATLLGMALALIFCLIGWMEDLPPGRTLGWVGMDRGDSFTHVGLVRGPLARWLTKPRGPDGWRWSALTLGEVIFLWREPEETTIPHELHHVKQFRILGIFFLLVWAAMTLVKGYRANPLEVAARRAAGEEP